MFWEGFESGIQKHSHNFQTAALTKCLKSNEMLPSIICWDVLPHLTHLTKSLIICIGVPEIGTDLQMCAPMKNYFQCESFSREIGISLELITKCVICLLQTSE